jgi:hypothetical protein
MSSPVRLKDKPFSLKQQGTFFSNPETEGENQMRRERSDSINIMGRVRSIIIQLKLC